MAKRADPRFIITEHRPWRIWILSALLIVASGTIGWFLPHLISASLDLIADTSSSPAHLSAQEKISYLDQENARLRKSLAQTQRELKIEQHARMDLSTDLEALQNKIYELNRQLSAYKGLIKSLEDQGFHIQDFSISKTVTARLFHYHLVLTQGRKTAQLTQGQAQLVIYGVLNGRSAQFNLDSLSKANAINFKFKYFQILEGELLLPNNFKPTQVKITLYPNESSSKLAEKTFNWASIKN
ncbi:hypothetical conserved protein [Candidatus Nitrosoglobus terrae]|uniref:Hypothetical conserved protein n=1 Tax=Candidatus Nitrosoglobus terrae TaxID=1630141 RepID=A0A1Q2SK23_9GAMM|nr:DUF6776 family protein [Candidatus Nitrosoglobus terrae]BAW79495.1 hypothetical conserved protein [Candidatus Nitrosoglobus terrae]